MKKEKIFELEQRKMGELWVCTCCNTTVSPTEKQETVDGHQLHYDCAEKLGMINTIKKELRTVIATLPADLFSSGSNVLERLERSYTPSGFKLALHTFCEYLAGGKHWLKEQFNDIATSIKEIIERSKLKNFLAPAIVHF